MIVVCPTVPHTGTHFMRDMFERAGVEALVTHPHATELPKLRGLLEMGNPMIYPVRDRWATLESWIKYDKDPRNFAGMSLPQWFEVQQDLANVARTMGMEWWLPIDDVDVGAEYLTLINKAFRIQLTTDWQPIRQPGA